jgi:hypothetical protein
LLPVESSLTSRHFQPAVSGLNPAYRAFLDSLGAERVWAQLLITREGVGFTLRHVRDRDANPAPLKTITVPDLRKLAMFDASGQFRPLRSAPDLVNGWVCHCKTDEELARAIQQLYPGSIPDWYSTQNRVPPITNYREFTNRQSGMYRITQFLTDTQAAQVIAACCNRRFCLKRRLWTVESLAPDDAESKSAIPCLEPCAVLLELARKATRIEQEDKTSVQISGSELATLVLAAKLLLETGSSGERTGDISSPLNPRRLQLVVEKFGTAADAARDKPEESSS